MIVVSRNTLNGRLITHQGELVATPKWVEYDAICLSTDRSDKFKFRIIPKENIVSINGQESTYVQPVRPKEVTVAGSKGAVYTVTFNGNNATCTCSGFMFRRSCRHIVEAQAA